MVGLSGWCGVKAPVRLVKSFNVGEGMMVGAALVEFLAALLAAISHGGEVRFWAGTAALWSVLAGTQALLARCWRRMFRAERDRKVQRDRSWLS